MDRVFRVVAHDVVGHGVVGLGAVAESFMDNLIAKCGLVDFNELAAP